VADERMRVAVVYGGRSGEHEVSVESARSVLEAIDRSKYDVLPVRITHEGMWAAIAPDALLNEADPVRWILPSAEPLVSDLTAVQGGRRALASLSQQVDVVFPLVHGTYGEDGCLQGLLELANLPYVGASVLASAVGMDKIIMKSVFQASGLPVVEYIGILRSEWEHSPATVTEAIADRLGFPCFVKPSNLGSSVGISKVRARVELPAALNFAAEFSSRIIAERGIDAREIECGVLGNDQAAASVVGEVAPARDFYDYAAKYMDTETRFDIPARLDEETIRQVRDLSLRAFAAVGASGMARVDFFVDRDSGKVFINEINTIPGFTSMSVYPRLWAASGVQYAELIDRLIQLAIERHADMARNRTRYAD